MANKALLLFLLFLTGSSSSLFSANAAGQESSNWDQQELVGTSFMGEQVTDVFDPLLPFQQHLLFAKASFTRTGEFEALERVLASASEDYIKSSRYILPSLGVRELIFPFHIFL